MHGRSPAPEVAWHEIPGVQGTLTQYNGGFAQVLKDILLTEGMTLSVGQIEWLYDATGRTRYLSSAMSMCQELIDKATLERITERLSQ